GKWIDLSVYPANKGYEDLILMASKPALPFAWTALTLPEDRYIWFSLKDPQVLPSTIFWMSNGGRHYPPWNGRHKRVIGLEEVVAYFHHGLERSARFNPMNRAGIPTTVQMKKQSSLVVNYIMAVAAIPAGFDIAQSIRPSVDRKSVRITSKSGKSISIRLNIGFLKSKPDPSQHQMSS
ncbi:MAG: hypothetical protein ABI076_03335, partial [Acidobacteriaceae bacterium]